MSAEVPPASRLLLVDGLAGAYRFFYAIRNLSTAANVPVNAVFGFIRMMQQLQRIWSPTHWAVAFDGGIPPLRLELVPAYKANRKPMPEDLRGQLPVLNDYLETAAIPYMRLEDCEADDVIATLAVKAEKEGSEVLIATGDKDLFQLVNDKVRLISLSGEPQLMDTGAVKAKTGVLPGQIPDWLALTGDNADNIQGVPGVGPKTAAKLLSAFGSLEVLYSRLDAVESNSLRQSLENSRAVVERNLKMVRLDCSVEGVPDWHDFSCRSEPVKPLLAFYRKYELHTFANALAAPELF